MRTDLGSVIVLRPEWAVPNAFDDNGEDYAESTSQHCLDLALTWFSGAKSGSIVLSNVTDEWSRQVDRAKRGVSWAAHEASS